MFLFQALLSLFTGESPPTFPPPPNSKYSSLDELFGKTLVCDVEGSLLRSSSMFPYFMLVALEAGGYLRGLLLLISYPLLLCCASHEAAVRAMTMIAFCGLRADRFRAGKAVLPKHFLEDVGLEGFEVLRRGGRRVCVSCMPRVMVEWFLKEYLEVEVVVARDLKVVGGYFTGFMEEDFPENNKGSHMKGLIEGMEHIADGLIGFASSKRPHHHHPLFSHCKEVYLVDEADKRKWHSLPREEYPKPLIFHDGRLAFRPTFSSTIAMYMWLPLGFPLAILRFFIAVTLPYKLSTPILAMTGMTWKLRGKHPSSSSSNNLMNKGSFYVCNHRTLIDPIYVSIALNKPVTAVTYSLSRFSEMISLIKTVRLTRDREIDKKKMEELLSQGDLVVCPEGTTCREPYLLRFSPLFTELSDEIVPVAIDVRVTMFYATTAGGLKGLDSLYYLLNPWMSYELEFLEKVDTSSVRAGKCRGIDMANHVQKEIGRALGFECTMLARKDKYLMLAGNNGTVVAN